MTNTTIVKLFLPYCSCCNPLAVFQQRYETSITEILENNYNGDNNMLNKAQSDANFLYGWRKICCLNAIINSPTYFILNSNAGSITSNVIFSGENLSTMTYNDDYIYKDGPAIVPRRTPPDFPVLPGITMAKSPLKKELIFRNVDVPKANSVIKPPFTITQNIKAREGKMTIFKNVAVPT